MKFSNTVRSTALENGAFLILLVAVTVAFFWLLLPFFGAVFWGAVFALMFKPLFVRLLKRMPRRRTVAALLAMAIILVMVILPLTLISASLTREASNVYDMVKSGDLNVSRYLQEIYDVLPSGASALLHRFGLDNFAEMQQKITELLSKGSQFFATQALNIGQNTFDFFVSFFVMMYLLFFLLRDGSALAKKLQNAIPLNREISHQLSSKFATVVRATVRGNIVIAALQGTLGGLIFWFLGIHAPVLWGTLMAFLSLLPAVGAALVWVPVALYFLATGALGKGMVLIAFGVLVIGLVDNLLRPMLVGKDTRMPDYVVLVSTLGGMALFGLNGFVIGPVIAAMFIAVWDIFSIARTARVESEPATPEVTQPPPGQLESEAPKN